MAPVLEIRSLSAFYGPVAAVRDVSLAIGEGEAVGLGGANGAGKSTLLKAMLGLVPTRGEILLDGVSIGRWPTNRRIRAGMVYVPQERMVVGGITVLENLRLFWLAGDRQQTYHDAVDRVLEAFPELARRRGAHASALSGGERQMLAVSRAFVTSEPRVLLLDEPSAGLAPLVIARISELLRGWREQSMTFLLLEQNERLLDQCCERRLSLASGDLVPEAGAARPETKGAGS